MWEKIQSISIGSEEILNYWKNIELWWCIQNPLMNMFKKINQTDLSMDYNSLAITFYLSSRNVYKVAK